VRVNFEKLAKMKSWADPQSPTRPKKYTKLRQQQLADIFDLYDGAKIPFSHFTNDLVENAEKRNRLAFPAVFGYLFGILKIDGDGLVKPKDLILGERHFLANEVFWL
jgi:hypothetical protein